MTSELRKPYDNELDDCAELIYISGPDLYSYIFVEREPKVYGLIRLLCQRPDSLFSKENIVVEEENSNIRGLILAYPASDMKKMVTGMLKCLKGMFMISGLLNFMKIMFRLRLNMYFPGTKNDELFISNLAVFEKYRGQGIAVKLLEKAEEIAVGKGLSKLSLYVETDNSHARRVYEKFGFQEVKKVVLPERYKKHNLFGFYKLIKNIEVN